jgi:hypothetical protein
METIEPTTYALKAYQSILEKHGHRRGEIYKRMHMARCIMGSLPKGLPSNLAYRKAVDAVLMTMPDEASADTCRLVARDLYPFYEQDVPTIAAMAQTGAFERLDDIQVELPPHKDLDDLIKVTRSMLLSPQENALLNAYAEHLLAQGVDAKVLENRTTTCRLLLLGLRGLPHDGKHYRAVIDRLLPLFKRDETRAYFLVVARQFYSFLET